MNSLIDTISEITLTVVKYLGLVRDSFRSFNSEMAIFEANSKPGDCGTFNGWTYLWIREAPGFTDVPAIGSVFMGNIDLC